jgi:peptide/nickel transport system permease protein
VLSYLVRRLLLMVPTFFGILVINFAVMRFQGPTLVEELNQRAAGAKGDEGRKIEGAVKNVETYLGRFRRTGNDRPAIVNTRGWTDKDDALEWLREIERGPGTHGDEAQRNRKELELWFQGPMFVKPLYEIIADDSLKEYHGVASFAFSLCAYVPLNVEDLDRMSIVEQSRVQARNGELKQCRIAFANDGQDGFSITDEDYETKRARIRSLFAANERDFTYTTAQKWRALFLDTGFCHLSGSLFTGRLYSETRRAYVYDVIAERWHISFWLNFLSMVIAWGIAVPLGIRSARRIGTWEDRATTNTLFLLWSLPSFFIGTIFLHHLCTDTGSHEAIFPNRGLSSENSLWMSTPRYLLDLLWHAFLPLVVLCYGSFTSLSRYMRGNLLEQLNSDYVRSARAKGCSEDQIVYGHALKNSMVTMITLGAGLLSELFGGFLIVENIFSIPGLGTLLLDAARQNDAPLVMGSTVISVGLLLVGILIADVMYAVVDPRVRSRYV